VKGDPKLDSIVDSPSSRLALMLGTSDESNNDNRSTLEVVIMIVMRVVTEKELQMLEDSFRSDSSTEEDSVQDTSELLEPCAKLSLSSIEGDRSEKMELSGAELTLVLDSVINVTCVSEDVHNSSGSVEERSRNASELERSAIDRLDECSLDGSRAGRCSSDDGKMLVGSETLAGSKAEDEWSNKLRLCCCEPTSEGSALDKVSKGA